MDVTLPNGQVINGVPDGTTKAQLAEKLKANGFDVPQEWLTPAAPAARAAPQPQTNFRNPYAYFNPEVQRGVGNTGERSQYAIGAGEAALQTGTGLASSAAGGLAGIGNAMWNHSLPGYLAQKAGLPRASSADVVQKIQQAGTYQPRTFAGQVSSQAVSDAFDPNVKSSWLNPLALPGNVGTKLGDVSADMGAPAPVSLGLRMAPEVLFPYAASKAGDAVRGAQAARAANTKPPVPTTEQLRSASKAAYEASDQAGVVLTPDSTLRVVDMMKRVADSENLGKLPPKIKEASDILTARLDEGKPLKLKDADKVRQLINDAKKSTDAADQRLASIIQSEYDQYLTNLGREDVMAGNKDAGLKALTDARDLFRRSKNSEMLDNMEHDAGLTGSTNYTQAGVELAMRREFLRLAKNEREMKKLTPAQRAAVEKVANPGAGANTLRNIGKFDPTRGGMPAFMVSMLGGGGGAAIAGPAGAVVAPAVIGTVAHLANRGAARITRNNVAAAREALVGRGLPSASAPAAGTPGIPMPLAKTLIGTQATRAPDAIRADIQRVVRRAGTLKGGPSSESARSIWLELARLEEELKAAEQLSGAQGVPVPPQSQ